MFENLDQPYPFNNNFKHNMKTIGLVCMGFILIVLYIQPFGINFLRSEHDGYFVLGAGLLNAGTLFVNTLILPGIFPRLFDPSKWTIRKEIIWNIWMFVHLFAFLTFMAWVAKRTSFTDLPLIKTGALSLLPLILFNLINYNAMLRNKVVSVIDSGKQWFKDEKEVLLNHPQKKIRIVAENGKDIFEEKIDNVLLIHSSGNYIEIFRTDSKEIVRKKLFRQSLANVERTLKDSEEFKKCHRCWMVNMNKVSGLIGNSKGYSLNINGIDLSVPVSRNYFATFKERLS
jgi:hypothetical protein